ncbi:MAG: hypothetical protein L0312_02515 [Acidobacteria bacterium]|nr:hypothetical protein [Acidobacteriota bacterium]
MKQAKAGGVSPWGLAAAQAGTSLATQEASPIEEGHAEDVMLASIPPKHSAFQEIWKPGREEAPFTSLGQIMGSRELLG